MITTIKIKNFKSVADLTFSPGLFNVIIGENGCGKSNILEAIAMGAASNADQLEFGLLPRRGIRMTPIEFMFSSFKSSKKIKPICVDFFDEQGTFPVELIPDKQSKNRWINSNKITAYKEIDLFTRALFNNDAKAIKDISENEDELNWISSFNNLINKSSEIDKNNLYSTIISSALNNFFNNNYIANYIVFSPEQSSLRNFSEPSQTMPLGVKGDGLFQLLKAMHSDKKKNKQIKEIKKNLEVLDWFEDYEIPIESLSNEYSLRVKDKYIDKTLDLFDQRSTNEGFLFLLFYLTLFISDETPSFFAIDNIEATFNPKLCTSITHTLTNLSKKHKKQVILTTHNPAILDGLNLKDDKIRLFVASRNLDGHTRLRRIEYKPSRTISLSEAWRSGLIGGLPDNF